MMMRVGERPMMSGLTGYVYDRLGLFSPFQRHRLITGHYASLIHSISPSIRPSIDQYSYGNTAEKE